MSKEPKICPALLATVTEAAPKRLVRKLDNNPQLARRWLWQIVSATDEQEVLQVTTDKGECVTLPLTTLAKIEQVQCSCLLAPRCLHILAVLSQLQIADAELATETAGSSAAADSSGSSAAVDSSDSSAAVDSSSKAALTDKAEAASTFSEKEIQSARATFETGAQILSAGIPGSGPLLQANLLRVIHSCRTDGLHRLATASLRVLQDIQKYRAESPLFHLSDYTNNLQELLEVAHKIANGREGNEALRGTARRKYEAVGSLILTGLLCEPILTDSGYAGVCTYLIDSKGQVFTLSDVMPGDSSRVRPAYAAPISVGDVSLAHKYLCRQGLLLQEATASSDGRLGHGKKTKSARRKQTAWTDEDVAHLWQEELASQLEAICIEAQKPLLQRNAGWNFIYVEGTIVGVQPSALLLNVQGKVLRCVVPNEDEQLPYNENFRQLGRRLGLQLRAVGRVRLWQRSTIELLAIGLGSCANEQEQMSLPEKWNGRVNLGYERLQGLHFAKSKKESKGLFLPEMAAAQPDPLHVLTRRLRRMALGGRATLPPEAAQEIERERAKLQKQLLPTGGRLLGQLLIRAHGSERTIAGVKQVEPIELAKTWLAATIYTQSAKLDLNRKLWLT